MTHPSPELLAFAEAVERLAFEMPAPNAFTPRFVQMCIEARRRRSSPAGEEIDTAIHNIISDCVCVTATGDIEISPDVTQRMLSLLSARAGEWNAAAKFVESWFAEWSPKDAMNARMCAAEMRRKDTSDEG
jgi:hypothetical protein